jgi:hypothetical protein
MVKETAKEFKKDGSVGSQFEADGAIGARMRALCLDRPQSPDGPPRRCSRLRPSLLAAAASLCAMLLKLRRRDILPRHSLACVRH